MTLEHDFIMTVRMEEALIGYACHGSIEDHTDGSRLLTLVIFHLEKWLFNWINFVITVESAYPEQHMKNPQVYPDLVLEFLANFEFGIPFLK